VRRGPFAGCGLGLLVAAAACGSLAPPQDQAVGPLPSAISEPEDNRGSPGKIALGRLLFWDPVLAGDRDVACATCHHPDFAYADGRAVSVGVGGAGLGPARSPSRVAPHFTARNSMTILNVAWNGLSVRDPSRLAGSAPMFWDSRVVTLEEQVRGPMLSKDEMLGEHVPDTAIFSVVAARLQAIPEYVALFDAAFGSRSIGVDNIARAIASFERTLVERDCSFDRFMQGDDGALTLPQKRGLFLFIQAGCASCHSGPMFSDFRLHALGVADLPSAVHDPGDGHERFRTPSLRDVTRTAPYMHNGSLQTLEDVLSFYFHLDHTLDPDLEALDCVNDKDLASVADLVAFLGSISDGTFDRSQPERVPSGLPPGGLK
jgi:cytochrome c peroxidase